MYVSIVFLGSNTFPARSFPPDGTTFAQVTLGDKASNVIAPYSYWNMQFYHSEAAYIRFELGLPRSASLGLYGRRNALPTHTHHDMLHVISGYKNRNTRASTVRILFFFNIYHFIDTTCFLQLTSSFFFFKCRH